MNSFNIVVPDLTPMYNAVRDYIKNLQGDKEYVFLNSPDTDILWTMVYTDIEHTYEEHQIYAIRVKNNAVQIVYDVPYLKCSVEYIESLSDSDWHDIRYDDYIYYLPTIFNIAEAIAFYET